MVKQTKAASGAFFKMRPASFSAFFWLLITGYCLLSTRPLVAADLYPGDGATMSANSAAAALPVKTSSVGIFLLAPSSGAVEISQSPSLHVGSNYQAGTAMQYHFQVDTLPTMNSQSGSPQGDFDQSVAQFFASSGAFSGQNATISSTNDAYSGASTATFVYYSSSSIKLIGNAKYYWRARAKPSTGVYGDWSSTASFVTTLQASVNPVNNLAISGVTLYGANSSGLASIGFTITENNAISAGVSANGGAYNTADWVFVKFSTAAGADGTWNHATLVSGMIGTGATLTTATDNKGVYLNHTSNYSSYWSAGGIVTWDFGADGVADGLKSAIVQVFAISMVKVPTGDFIYNAGGIGGGATTGNTAFNNYSAGAGLSALITDGGLTTGNGSNNLPAGAPVGWPNGHDTFYIGRYEITQGQYADFLNAIPSTLAASLHYGAAANGHNMTNTGIYPNKYAAVDPNAAKNYLSFDDAWRYLSWAGLRPPTEMEFEKAGRDLSPDIGHQDARIYPWGSTPVPDAIVYTPPNEGGACIKKFMNFGNLANCQKVLDVGRYMSGDVYRTPEETGTSPWGIADLLGNVYELIINCKWASMPMNGDGTPTLPASWPVPYADTAGRRGGGFLDSGTALRLSDRYDASFTGNYRAMHNGVRPARTP